jgi:hypothetical protein
MVKFSSKFDPTYSTALKMLREYVKDAGKVVDSRYGIAVLWFARRRPLLIRASNEH